MTYQWLEDDLTDGVANDVLTGFSPLGEVYTLDIKIRNHLSVSLIGLSQL